MEACRLCLWKSNDGISIINIFHDVFLRDKIKENLPLQIEENDDLPNYICMFCVKKLNDWIEFKETCLKSEVLLKASKCDKSEENWTFSLSEDESEDGRVLEPEDKGQSSQYICEICHKEFGCCFEFLDHQSTHDGQTVFQCEKCSLAFQSRKDLVDHDQQHKRPCPKCGKLILKSSLKLHLNQHTDKYVCPKCSHRFSSRSTLQQHILTVHTKIRDHICETCGRRFSTKTAMTSHLKTHSEERLYPCKICSYSGRTSSAIYIHMATHAQETHVCEVCSKIFKSTRNLTDHLRRVHSKDKKHECSYCGKKFVDKYMLEVHLRCHTGVRPYRCELCDKTFVRSDSLKEHVKIHGVRTLFDCGSCSKKFTSKRGLTRHQCAFSA